jgi:glycosyltransferase involved in cell wall biosynthesis
MVAPLLGAEPDRAPDVFERLGPLLRDRGHDVTMASTRPRTAARVADMLWSTVRTRRTSDVLLVHLYSGRSFLVEDLVSALAGARARIGLLAGGGLPELGQRKPRWVRRVLERFDHLVAPSEYLARWARSTVGVPVTVIPNPLDPDTYRFRLRARPGPRLLWLRAFHPIYDPATAVRAVAALRPTFPDISLTMVGADKGARASVEALVDELGLPDAVDVGGFADEDRKRTLLDAHDVFLNTALVDNRPVSVVEAAAAGLCIVSSEVGGVPDLLVDGDSGLLVEPGSPTALAAAVGRVLAEPDLAARLSAGGRAVAEAGRPESVASAWAGVIEAVAGGRPAR